jgi:hypothetical protein
MKNKQKISPKIQAVRLIRSFKDWVLIDYTGDEEPLFSHQKGCALMVVNNILKYHDSLFDEGLKDVAITAESPIRTVKDVLNPLRKYWKQVKVEIELANEYDGNW